MSKLLAAVRSLLAYSLGGILLIASCDRAERSADESGSPTTATSNVFRDITASAGLTFRHYTGASGEFYLPEIMGSGCAFLDFDSDGDLDVYAVQGALLGEGKTLKDSLFPPRGVPVRNRLFRNDLVLTKETQGKLSFMDVTAVAGVGDEAYGMGCAVGDYDNDGHPDLYVTNFGPNVLYHNRGDGTFDDVTGTSKVDEPRFSASAAFLDYDRDGFLDLFVTNYVHFATAANRDCFRLGGQRTYCGPRSYEAAGDRLYRNRGDGTFEDVTRSAGIHLHYGYGLGVVCDDFNADGWVDIFVANDATPNQLWVNRTNGTFEDLALVAGVAVNADGLNEAGMGVTAGDYDRDGDLDLFLTHERLETNTLYRNLGAGWFEDATSNARLGQPSLGFSGFGTRWFDYDNDGWLDLFVANGAVQTIPSQSGEPHPFNQSDHLYRNVDGRFALVASPGGSGAKNERTGRGVAFGDVDNDGDIDLLVLNNNGPARLLVNHAGGGGHWVQLLLQGTRSSRDAYGARVALELGSGVVLWRTVRTDGSYCSANDRRVHFGLGEESTVKSVTVYWLGGRVERWGRVAIDALTALREGEGEAVEKK